jgi:hypothetical protein
MAPSCLNTGWQTSPQLFCLSAQSFVIRAFVATLEPQPCFLMVEVGEPHNLTCKLQQAGAIFNPESQASPVPKCEDSLILTFITVRSQCLLVTHYPVIEFFTVAQRTNL